MIRLLHSLIASVVLVLGLGLATVQAHKPNPGLLSLSQSAPARFLVQWVAPSAADPTQLALQPVFPAHCTYQSPWLDCGTEGLAGILSVDGLDVTGAQIVVHVTWQNGVTHTEVLSPERPSLSFRGHAGAQSWRGMAGTAYAYVQIGVEHILLGIDHMLFVLGLVLLVGFGRRLLWTITAFTLAHSLTLAGSVLGVLQLPQAPVEAVIALSIVLLAVECLQPQVTWTQRIPWAVSFGFGLLHGCGFAGALQDIGLPPGQVPLALLCFHVGVEIGQLGVIGSVYLLLLGIRQWGTSLRPVRTALIYSMGTVAVFWSVERIGSVLR